MPSINQLGGVSDILNQIEDLVHLPLIHNQIFTLLNVQPPKGVLICGNSGCGKTVLGIAIGKSLQQNLAYHFIYMPGTELIGGISGESENNIRQLFYEASENAPSLVFIDDIETIGVKKGNLGSKQMEQRIVNQLINCIDTLPNNVFLLASTSKPELLDSALRRCGRFDKEIVLKVPNEKIRTEILQILLKNQKLNVDGFNEDQILQQTIQNKNFINSLQCKNIDKEEQKINNFIIYLGKITSGYVPADLNSLVREAGLIGVKRIVKQNFNNICPFNTNNIKINEVIILNEEDSLIEKQEQQSQIANNIKCEIQYEDFLQAIKQIQPTASREGFSVVPNVTWDQIGALADLKKELEESITLPIIYSDKFKKFGLNMAQGVLLYGPPGCGKTLLAKAVANSAKTNFIAVKGPELLSKYFGESEKSIRELFNRAKFSSPCVIFFDELDALCPKRESNSGQGHATERVTNQLLTEMDGIDTRKDIFIIAATNRPDIIDPAILRAGRLSKKLYVPLPNQSDRYQILLTLTKTMPIGKNVDFEFLSHNNKLKNFSGADLANFVREAALKAIINNQDEVFENDFEVALNNCKSSINEFDLKKYENQKKIIEQSSQ